MGREVRMVPADFIHPKDGNGHEVPLMAEEMEKFMPPGPRVYFVMYETYTEGTPISPPFESAEGLARWLADTGASAFGDMTASYEAWLATIRKGYSVGFSIAPGGKMVSGVEHNADLEREQD